jgi:hypothetical protein
MFLATIICSDPGCDEVREVAVERLSQLDGFSCECGYGFVLAAIAELRDAGGEVVAIAPTRVRDARRAA